MKYLQIIMPNGERWAVPISIIAANRATYYADKDAKREGLTKEERDKLYEEEYNYTIEDELEIYDWAPNNMDWVDVKDHAVELGVEKMSERGYQEGWVNGEKTIIDLVDSSEQKVMKEVKSG